MQHVFAPDGWSLPRRVESVAADRPDKVAIDFYGRVLNYGDLQQAIMALAGYMQQRLEVRRGDRVLLFMQNCPQCCIAVYATLRCGAVVVATPATSSAAEVAGLARDAGARVLLTTQDLREHSDLLISLGQLTGCLVGARSDMCEGPDGVAAMEIPDCMQEPRRPLAWSERQGGMHEFAGAIAAGIDPIPVELTPDDLAVIAYTGGTDRPKGVMLTHRALALAVAHRSDWFAGSPDCNDLLTLPISQIEGLCATSQALCEGRTLVLLSRWDAAAVPALIERRRIDRWAAAAPWVAELLGRPELAKHDTSSLRHVFGSAAGMTDALARQVRERLGVAYIECYGIDETCGSSRINPPQDSDLTCAGAPQLGAELRVIDPQTGAQQAPGEPGEIVLHGPMHFEGYWNSPNDTVAAFIELDGKRFVRSGDLGHCDEHGHFHVTSHRLHRESLPPGSSRVK